MNADLSLYYPFLGAWAVIGGGIGLAMMDYYPSEPSPWQTANWAQKCVLLFAFGPLLWVLVPFWWTIKRTLVPAVAAAWRWLGTL